MRKSFNEKLNSAGDLPKIEDLSQDPKARNWSAAGPRMLIAAPLQYNEIVAKVPKGKLITVDRIREFLAHQAGADFTCPLTAGIFVNVVANASVERDHNQVPYWRTLKKDGELNEKYPGGIEAQKQLLEKEGFKVIQKGKRFFVEDYEKHLYEL